MKNKKDKKDRNYLQLRNGQKLHKLAIVQAEADKNLNEFYIARDRYVDRALDRDDLASVFIGPKGIGKTAVLQMVRIEQENNKRRLIDISPDDLAFNALTQYEQNSPVLQDHNNHRFLFKALWDYVLLVEIFRREFNERRSLMKLFKNALPGHSWEQEAKKLVDLAYRQDEQAGTFTARIIGLIDEVELSGQFSDGTKIAGTAKLRDPKQPSSIGILALINRVAREIPSRLQNEYWVLIDDLDIHWNNTSLQNSFLGSLFESMRRLARNDSIKFVASLRDNIYKQVHLDESDKYNDLVVEIKWTKQIVREIVEARLTRIFNLHKHDVWGGLFSMGIKGFDYIWDRSTGRPRDILVAVKFCVESALDHGEKYVTGASLEYGVQKYSEDAVKDWASEHRYSYRGLSHLATWFRGKSPEFHIDVIQELALDIEDQLMKEADNKPECAWVLGYFEDPWTLAKVLSELNFLFVKNTRKDDPRPYNPRTDKISADGIEWFAIHPRFRPGLHCG